jgi:hypothetical protein
MRRERAGYFVVVVIIIMCESPPRKRRRVEEKQCDYVNIIPSQHGLPPDMLREIAFHVTTPAALFNMFQVSKTWNEYLKQHEEEIWKHFVNRDFPGSPMPFLDIPSRELYFDRFDEFADLMDGYADHCHGFCVTQKKGRITFSSKTNERFRFKVYRSSACDIWMCTVSNGEDEEELTLREIIGRVLFNKSPRVRCYYTFTGTAFMSNNIETIKISVDWKSRRNPYFSYSI